MVRCFVCNERTERFDSYNKRTIFSYRFNPVTGGSEENKKFWERWTPGGQLTVDSVRFGLFEVGKEYFLDIAAPVLETNA